jgi:hypothetical protein
MVVRVELKPQEGLWLSVFSLLVPQLPLLNPERFTNSFHFYESFVLGLDGECALYGYPSPSKLSRVSK